MVQSLKTQILEKLHLRKGGRDVASRNISTATKDFAASDAPQFRGKSQKKRHQMAVAAGLSAARGESAKPKKGDNLLYEGKQVVVQSYNPGSGLAVVKRGRSADLIVRAEDLESKPQLTEGVLGMAVMGRTYVEPRASMAKLEPLRLADIGLISEDDFTGKKDRQEEDHDNGSNVRHDGHTGKKEVDELPTPSDTIAPAYDADRPPKIEGEPLSTHVGAEPGKLWQEPHWDGYDFPADAPKIPQADFMGDEGGNARAPDCDGSHEGGEQHEWESEDEDSERTDETYIGFNKLEKKLSAKSGIRNPGAVAASIGRKKYGKKKFQSAAMHHHSMRENAMHLLAALQERWHGDDEDDEDRRANRDRNKPSYRDARKAKEKDREEQMESLLAEMGDMLGHEDHEPREGDTITVTLPAMASILCTVAHRMGADIQKGGQDEMLLKAIIEALAEVGQGSNSGCIDVPDLEAVAHHINGEETQEIENREAGRPDHEDIHGHEPADSWPGDMEKSRTGKTKMMDGSVAEGIGGDFLGLDDIISETKLTDEEELRLIKKRAGLKFW